MTNTLKNHPKRAAFAAGILAIMFVAAACNPSGTPHQRAVAVTGNPVCQVGVIGDSLTVGARDFGGLQEKLNARGCEVTTIDARVGRPTSEGADIAEHWARVGAMPRTLVVALGTNDCSAAGFNHHARRILTAAGPDRPVLWVNTWRPGCDAAINGVLNNIQINELNKRPDMGNLWILDHGGWVAVNQGVLGRDRLHLTRAGYNAHADRIANAVVTG